MKKVFLGSLMSLLLIVPLMAQTINLFGASEVISNIASAVFSWEDLNHDFGQIKKDVPVSKEFSFTNTGDLPLVISKVKGSCGCTVTAYTEEAIAPGSKGYVKATYNAAKLGTFHKTVTVTANTEEGQVVLSIKGEVVD